MAEYKGTVELIGGLTPKNNGTFPLASAKDIQVDDTGKRLDEKLVELEQCGGTVTVIVDGQAGTASHSSTEIYALVQAGNSVVAVLPDYANYQYQYNGYNEPTAANAMRSTVEFIRTAVDENGIVTTDYIIIHDDKSADAGYYECTDISQALTLGIHSDGLVYIFIDGKPVGDGIEVKAAGDVYGYVDDDNNIIVQGNLGDGTYIVKYEMADGSTVSIGNLVLDNNVYYSVTKNLTNCVVSNGATKVVEGSSYSATITANSGYELSSVSVTMGGSAVSVSGGVINIASVTGDIVITAVAVETDNTYINLIPLSVDASGNAYNGTQGYKTNTRIRTSNGEEQASTDKEATGFMPVRYGQTIYFKDIDATEDSSNTIALYDASHTFIAGNYITSFMDGVASGGGELKGEYKYQTLTVDKWKSSQGSLTANSDVAYFRLSANEIDGNSIVTVDQPIV